MSSSTCARSIRRTMKSWLDLYTNRADRVEARATVTRARSLPLLRYLHDRERLRGAERRHGVAGLLAKSGAIPARRNQGTLRRSTATAGATTSKATAASTLLIVG